MFSRNTSIIGAALSLATGIFSRPHDYGRSRYPTGWAKVGRGKYRPHQNEREIARRLRQAERNEERQRARASTVTAIPADRAPTRVSRRWRWMA